MNQDHSYRVRYRGDARSLFRLLFKNAVLTALTAGLYTARAEAARRRYVWNAIEVHGQRLEFTGTGWELGWSHLRFIAVCLFVLGVPFFGSAPLTSLALAAVTLLVLFPFARHRWRAYLLSRTRWRGLRLGVEGSPGPYVRTFLVGVLLTALTLGLYLPWLLCRLRAITVNQTRLGSEPFRYDGRGGELFPIWVDGMLLTIVTLGVYGFWLRAAMLRYHLAHTHFAGVHGRSAVTGGQLLRVTFALALGTPLTLGIAFPWIATWAARTLLDRIDATGATIDFGPIVLRASTPVPVPATPAAAPS